MRHRARRLERRAPGEYVDTDSTYPLSINHSYKRGALCGLRFFMFALGGASTKRIVGPRLLFLLRRERALLLLAMINYLEVVNAVKLTLRNNKLIRILTLLQRSLKFDRFINLILTQVADEHTL